MTDQTLLEERLRRIEQAIAHLERRLDRLETQRPPTDPREVRP